MGIDIAVVCGLVLMAVLGYMRGLFSQAWSLGALVLSFLGARPVLAFLEARFAWAHRESLLGDWLYELGTGVVLYILLLVIGYILEKLLVERFKIISAGNRVLGAVLGFVKGGAGVLLLLWIVLFFNHLSPSKDGALKQSMGSSRVATLVAPYNPLNLLLLARIRPYLPNDVTGSKRPPIAPPAEVKAREAFAKLVTDQAFLEAYREHEFTKILMNPSFRTLVQDAVLLKALEQSQH